jgi:hypothetical protein
MKKVLLLNAVMCFMITHNIFAQETQTITDAGKHFTIEIPISWVQSSTKNAFAIVTACSDTINSNERITFIDVKNPNSLEKSNKTNKGAFKDFNHFKIIAEGDATLSGQPNKWFVYTFLSDDGSVSMKGKYYTIKNSGRGYSIMYVLQEDRFNLVQESFERVISSLKFNE